MLLYRADVDPAVRAAPGGGIARWLRHTAPECQIIVDDDFYSVLGKPVAQRAPGSVTVGPLVLIHEDLGWRVADPLEPGVPFTSPAGPSVYELFAADALHPRAAADGR